MRLLSVGWNGNEDVSIFLYTGQRLADGVLNWTQGSFDETKLLVNQFLFFLPGLLSSYKVWHLLSMGAHLIGAYAVYCLMRRTFASARGLAPEAGHYAGIYGGVLILYLFSADWVEPFHVNSLTVCMALGAAALTRRGASQPRRGGKAAALFTLACFCGSVAVGIRPYLAAFVVLIPAWASIARQLDEGRSRLDYRAVAGIFILWNLCLGLFLLAVNVLPYILTGQLDSFLAGVQVIGQRFAPSGLEWTLHILGIEFREMGALSTFVFCAWVAFLIMFLTGLAGGFYQRALALDLAVLAFIAPFAILALTFAKNFWNHYAQFFLPFISIGAVSLFVLLHQEKSRYLDLLIRRNLVVALPALLLVVAPVTELQTSPNPGRMAATVDSLRAVQTRHGLEGAGFLAPFNQYVHVALAQHRHGFPNVSFSADSSIRGWARELEVPPQFRLPRTFAEYCRMLDARGPKLLVFFKETTFFRPEAYWDRVLPGHLANCQLRNYDFFDVSADSRLPSDTTYYFIRHESSGS